MSELTNRTEDQPGFNRRSVMRGVAWSVPIIAAAIAAPAVSASGISAAVAFLPGPSMWFALEAQQLIEAAGAVAR